MKNLNKLSTYLFTLSLLISSTPIMALESARNELLADKLLRNLKGKISSSLQKSHARPLLPVDTSRMLMQCLSDEIQFDDIKNDILQKWQSNWKEKKGYGLEGLTTNESVAQNFNEMEVRAKSQLDSVTQLFLEPKNKNLKSTDNIKTLNHFTKNFNSIEFVELTVDKYLSTPSTRNSVLKMNQAALWVRFDLRGEGAQAKRLQERGVFKVEVKLQNKIWKISKVELLENEQLSTDQVQFENMTKFSNVEVNVPKYLRREAIRRGGYAMAIGDANKDNIQDIFVGAVGETILLTGQKNLTFNKSEQKSLNKQTLVKAAAFADFNNSGNEDLLLVRFAPNESQTKDDRSDIQIYKNKDGEFERREKIISFNKETAFAMPLALADFNNDGLLDFYVGFPGSKDFTTLAPAVHKEGLTSQGVFYNQGLNGFNDDPYKNFSNLKGDKTELSLIFPHTALAVDFNDDNAMDLIVIDDRGNLSPMYINKGGGNFESSAQKIGIGLMDYGMGIDAADLNGDGKVDFVMSAVNFNSSKRLKESCSMNWSLDNVVSAGTSGLRVFTGVQNGNFNETTIPNGLEYVGEGAGGVKVFDFNNDGLPDIYLTNGLWSGSENNNSQDISPYFLAASTLGILEDGLKSELRSEKFIYERASQNSDFKALLFNSDSQSAVMDLLSFYRGNLRTGKKSAASLSMAGNQRNRMFRNNGNGTFTEVGFMLGIDSMADGYMAATSDLNGDGNLDLILRNADPGYALNQFAPVEVFKNSGFSRNGSVTIKLRGTLSNRNAIGAKLEATIGETKYVQQIIGSLGTVQSEKLAHFGLGQKSKIDTLNIRWPSGKTQSLKNIESGFHVVDEPGTEMSSINK